MITEHRNYTIDCRADAEQFLLSKGKLFVGRPFIKFDTSLISIVEAFGIPLEGGNKLLLDIFKREKFFKGMEIHEDPEYSSINIGFYRLEDFYTFIDRVTEWLELTSKGEERPKVESLQDT